MEVQTTAVFDDWFAALRDREARQRIAVRIRRLGAGNPGQHRVLTGGVTESKVDFGPGYRIYLTVRAAIAYVLLCGGDKCTQSNDIATALRLAKEFCQ